MSTIQKFPTLMKGTSFENEKKFQEWFIKAIRANGWWAYKLPDTGYDFKPFDLIALKNGISLYVELKVTPSETIAYSSLRANQVYALEEVEKRGGIPMVIVYSKKTQTYKVFGYLEFKKLGSVKGKPIPIKEQTL